MTSVPFRGVLRGVLEGGVLEEGGLKSFFGDSGFRGIFEMIMLISFPQYNQ